MSSTPASPFAHCADAPSRRDLRARLFWVARWLLGATEYHRGPIQVAINEGDGPGERLIITPKPGDEVYDASDGPAETERLAELMPRLLATFVSADAMALLRAVADRGPVPAKAIAAASTIERTRCYELLRDLRERGLIRDTGDGYELAAPEVWAELLRRE